MNRQILRFPRVKAETGKCRSSIYLEIARGLFPKQVILGPRTVGWPAHEIAAINAARIAGKSEEDIRSLVNHLHVQRKQLYKTLTADEDVA